ncbi:MAG: pyridoxal phosphate-dependent decarboxylase family protein, partial [Pyrinomonadaceae bacterium]
PDFSGIIYDTASVSSLHAIAMARQKAAPQIREEGMNAQPRLKIYCSEQAHSSIEKAVILLGLGRKSLVKIPTDDQFRIQTDELQKAIVQDRNQGFLPFCVVATIGTTSTASVDNVEEIARICGRENCFLHVDAAYAGSAAIIPELQHHFKGWEMADTIVINPHKWLFTPFDLSILYVKDMPLLKQTFSLVPEYLKTSEGDVSEEVVNQMDYGIQLGRRFRSLKLWFAMRYFGQEGMINRIRENCRLAKLFANWIEESPNFQLLAPVHFALVCFRAWREGLSQDELNSINEKIMDKINASGKAYISHTKLNGNLALRLSVGSLRTEERHLKKVWELLNHYLSEELQASA